MSAVGIEYFGKAWNILIMLVHKIVENTSSINDLSQAFLAIIGGICAISGIRFIKSLREKRAASLFSFWSQLSVRLRQIKSRLEMDNSLVNNLYSPQVKASWTSGAASCVEEKMRDYKKLVESTLEYLKSAADQMPAYNGWVNDYIQIVDYLDDLIMYDILDSSNGFKFNTGTESDRTAYCNDICVVIERMISGILLEQNAAEKKLCKDYLNRTVGYEGR